MGRLRVAGADSVDRRRRRARRGRCRARPTRAIGVASVLEQARQTDELTGVQELVERWRQVAVLQSDPVAFRRSVRLVAGIATGEPVPEGEPFEVTRQKAGL